MHRSENFSTCGSLVRHEFYADNFQSIHSTIITISIRIFRLVREFNKYFSWSCDLWSRRERKGRRGGIYWSLLKRMRAKKMTCRNVCVVKIKGLSWFNWFTAICLLSHGYSSSIRACYFSHTYAHTHKQPHALAHMRNHYYSLSVHKNIFWRDQHQRWRRFLCIDCSWKNSKSLIVLLTRREMFFFLVALMLLLSIISKIRWSEYT